MEHRYLHMVVGHGVAMVVVVVEVEDGVGGTATETVAIRDARGWTHGVWKAVL
jgi:hypothetical protein